MSMLKNTANDALKDVTGVASDTVDLARTAGAFMITSAMAIKVTTKGEVNGDKTTGTELAFASGDLIPGYVYPLAIRRVWVTGTDTLSNVVLFYGPY